MPEVPNMVKCARCGAEVNLNSQEMVALPVLDGAGPPFAKHCYVCVICAADMLATQELSLAHKDMLLNEMNEKMASMSQKEIGKAGAVGAIAMIMGIYEYTEAILKGCPQSVLIAAEATRLQARAEQMQGEAPTPGPPSPHGLDTDNVELN